jgi:hypothetical protein
MESVTVRFEPSSQPRTHRESVTNMFLDPNARSGTDNPRPIQMQVESGVSSMYGNLVHRLHGRVPKKRIAVGVLGALVAVGAAVAYFTTTGSGTGNATVGTSEPLTITAVSASNLYPGTSSEVTFTVNNPSSGHQFVRKVQLAEVKAYKDEAHTEPEAGCKSQWFSMAEVTENKDVATGETTLPEKGSLEFVNEPESQDPCKGVYLVASFTSN